MNERKLRKLILKSVPFETQRLHIRPITDSDYLDMYEYSKLEEVCEYLLWSPHINPDVTRGYIEYLQQRYKKGLYADWAVIVKETGKMIGTCGFANVNTSGNFCEIGYVLSPQFQGKGYMTEAVLKLLDLTFNVFGFDTAKLRIISENEASVRLAKRLGFSFDEEIKMEIKGREKDVSIYLLTNKKYKKAKKEAAK